MQIAQWIRGSAAKTLQKLHDNSSESFGCGNHFTLSVEKWRKLVRQAWLMGFLKRSLAIGSAHNRMSNIVYAAYTVTDLGVKMMAEDEVEVLLPDEIVCAETKEAESNTEILNKSVVRKGKGAHILHVAKQLISEKEIGFLSISLMTIIFLVFLLHHILNDLDTVKTYPNYQIMNPVTHTFSILMFRLARAKQGQSD